MLGLAALLLAATSAPASSTVPSTGPWWEKVTYTIADDGTQQACLYEASFDTAQSCDDEAAPVEAASANSGTYAKITVERRFTTAGAPDAVGLKSGDTLLGGQIMALSIGADGAVLNCRVIGASGDMKPPYGCDEARAERFLASAPRSSGEQRQAFMTVAIYGHEEYLT